MLEKQETPALQLKSSQEDSSEPMSWQRLLLKATGLSLVFATILLFITVAVLASFVYFKLSQFLSLSKLSFSEARALVTEGVNKAPPDTDGRTTILILGIDTVANKSSAPPLTDTMLLASIEYQTGAVNLLSLPRDLWSESYKTKINALYYYGQDKYPDTPERFPSEVISEMTGVPIHYTVVFSLDAIAEIVDAVGGVAIDVPTGFTDREFPREDVDVTTTSDSAQLYETISFAQGVEVMDGARVKKYIRSRHSQGDTGTDVDRAARQQLVITTLVEALTSPQVLSSPTTMADIYSWYQRSMSSYIPVADAIAIAYRLLPVRKELGFASNSLSIKSAETEGVIEHLPPEKTENQWTYSIVDPVSFKQSVQNMLLHHETTR